MTRWSCHHDISCSGHNYNFFAKKNKFTQNFQLPIILISLIIFRLESNPKWIIHINIGAPNKLRFIQNIWKKWSCIKSNWFMTTSLMVPIGMIGKRFMVMAKRFYFIYLFLFLLFGKKGLFESSFSDNGN